MPMAGDVPGVCANDGIAIKAANKIALNEVNIFMTRILAVTSSRWQVTSNSNGKKLNNSRPRRKLRK
jgi:hypothetical protein